MKLDLLTFLIFSLAIWRISSLVANEDGPFHIFKHIRNYCEKLCNENKLAGKFHLYDGICCEWCNSIWFAFPLALILEWNLFNLFFVPLAASAFVIFFKYVREAVERYNHVV